MPTEVREKMAIYAGDMVNVQVKASQIIITPQTVVDRSGFPNANDEYTPEQRKKITAELLEAMKEPSIGPFDTAEEMIADMKKKLKKIHTAKKLK